MKTARKFVQYENVHTKERSLGILDNGVIRDLCHGEHKSPRDMKSFLESGPEAWELVFQSEKEMYPCLSPDEVRLLPPVSQPDKIIGAGLNYRDHCEELGLAIPTEPVLFGKFASALIGHNDVILHPKVTKQLDWEVELAVVIGRKCKDVSIDDAMEYVFGFTVVNDVTARDWMFNCNGGQFLLGKSMDTFCPLGPALVYKDDIKDCNNLAISSKVNGVLKQNSSTKEMIFNPAYLLSHISRFMTLYPGDIIMTGTPPGVGHGRSPPEYLKKDDVVECSIEGIGTLVNTVG